MGGPGKEPRCFGGSGFGGAGGGGEVALTRRPSRAACWGRGTWPLLELSRGARREGRPPGSRLCRDPAGVKGRSDPGAGRPSRAGAPGILCWGDRRRPGAPGARVRALQPRPRRILPPQPGDTLRAHPGPKRRPEFRDSSVHLQRNFSPGPLGGGVALQPTARGPPPVGFSAPPRYANKAPKRDAIGRCLPRRRGYADVVGAPDGYWLRAVAAPRGRPRVGKSFGRWRQVRLRSAALGTNQSAFRPLGGGAS